MGCTSSAPNMASHHKGSTDKKEINTGIITMDEIEEEKLDETMNIGNETKVLPQCDTLRDLIQLDRNNKSFVDAKPETDRSVQIELNYTHDVIGNTTEDPGEVTKTHLDDKLSTLEEVVEKVVEMYTENGTLTTDITKTVASNDNNNTRKEDELTIETEMTCDKAQAEDENQREDNPEQASPSPSESSRATRWEALADIAAELPPFLAVDPITGQIYSLTK